MVKITIIEQLNKEVYEFQTEEKAIRFYNELIDSMIESEESFLLEEGQDMVVKDKIERLKKLDRTNFYELEDKADLIIGDYNKVEIEEYDNTIYSLLDELEIGYDRSMISKSIYIRNNEDLLIRISDHKIKRGSKDYGHESPDVELIYLDGVVNNKEINKYLNSNLKDEVIIL